MSIYRFLSWLAGGPCGLQRADAGADAATDRGAVDDGRVQRGDLDDAGGILTGIELRLHASFLFVLTVCNIGWSSFSLWRQVHHLNVAEIFI